MRHAAKGQMDALAPTSLPDILLRDSWVTGLDVLLFLTWFHAKDGFINKHNSF